jgi:hypothetical protein
MEGDRRFTRTASLGIWSPTSGGLRFVIAGFFPLSGKLTISLVVIIDLPRLRSWWWHSESG